MHNWHNKPHKFWAHAPPHLLSMHPVYTLHVHTPRLRLRAETDTHEHSLTLRVLAVLTFVWTVLQFLRLLRGHMAWHQRKEFLPGRLWELWCLSKSLTVSVCVCLSVATVMPACLINQRLFFCLIVRYLHGCHVCDCNFFFPSWSLSVFGFPSEFR